AHQAARARQADVRASRSQRRTALASPGRTSLLRAGGPSSRSTAAGRGALAEAPDHAGKPYAWGASGPDSFDCSGFTMFLFGHQGVRIPRTASDQYAAGTKVDQDGKQPGDLIFTDDGGGISHVGIYAGGGTMWAAPKSGDHVRQQTIWTDRYYVGRFA
ncbi:MAG: hydrolase, partial [Frankiales bacterium]|nr:hydrolase [Frankiales bacterium]